MTRYDKERIRYNKDNILERVTCNVDSKMEGDR